MNGPDIMMNDQEQLKFVQKLYPSVSRETFSELSKYVDLVRKWQPAQNLIAPSTMGEIWLRHVADCIQIQQTLPEAKSWIDFGSGAGFPGLVTAILLRDQPEAVVHMVESNQRKVAFLRTVARETGCNVKVHAGRIEKVTAGWQEPIDGVSARALANLKMLCDFSHQFISRGARAVFHKGKDYQREIEEASHFYELDLIEKESLIDPLSRVLVISKMGARAPTK
ncbi:16S rRNA (guanine(527)-N(7))-methyltransferase RsmG [Polycladidibacter stylochi]|uniref:16S rRNA (guanine(527)-N(7))-methyltransferase RsmG n=1 Tax=Polycladidibacter stylochi TaxID=1807766 RepID=UPI000834F86D|nr:16S rRNA (guanine(527)-N(7))-methyltransferase RsmG [Pseudovibrio stylochi]